MRTIKGHEGRVDESIEEDLLAWVLENMLEIDSRVILSQIGNRPKGPTYDTKEEEALIGKTKGYNAGNREIVENRIH